MINVLIEKDKQTTLVIKEDGKLTTTKATSSVSKDNEVTITVKLDKTLKLMAKCSIILCP